MSKKTPSIVVAALSLAFLLANPAAHAEASPGALGQAAASADEATAKSLRDLAALRETIRAEKLPMSDELARLESELADLRRTYDETVRQQDTQALETGNLQVAMKLRQDETTYISNLMDEYARGFETAVHPTEISRWHEAVQAARLAPQNPDLSASQKLERQVGLLKTALSRLNEIIGGTRYEGEAVDPQGTVTRGSFAMVGPVVMFAGNGGVAGIALPQSGSARAVVRPLEATLNAGLAKIVETGDGLLPLDPTRGGALKELVSRASLIYYFKKGGPIMWPLLFVSLLATTVILERLLFLARERRHRDPEAVETLLARVAEADLDGAIAVGSKSSDFVARALTYALQHREKSLSNALMRASGAELVRFTRGISVLDTCVTMAPLLGLMGTVTGMMASFGMLGGAELSAPAQITGGIAEALIATAFGLGIAVTALIPMNYLHNKSDAARHEIEDASTHLELLMKPIQDRDSAEARGGRRLDDSAELDDRMNRGALGAAMEG